MRITTTTRMVEVDVVAKDSKGRPVNSLEAKDFVLRDNGRVQKISRFSIERGTLNQEDAQPARGATARKGATTVFSNAHPANLTAMVILVDMLNTPIEDQALLRKSLIQSLSEIKSPPPIALLVLAEDLRLLSDFTIGTASLSKAVENLKTGRGAGIGPTLDAPVTPNLKFDAAIAKANIAEWQAQHTAGAERTLAALKLIRQDLKRIQGRKSLLWISGGLVLPLSETHAMQQAVDDFNNDNITIYTVDARGMAVEAGLDASQSSISPLAQLLAVEDDTRGAVMEVLAKSTGGVAYRNTNALSSAITQAVEDSGEVYALAYYPDHNNWNGEYHKLQVQVNHPGVHLRYRSGYLASPEPPPTSVAPEQQFLEIANSPVDSPGLPFSVEVKPGEKPGSVRLILRIVGSALQLQEKGDDQVGLLQLWCRQRNPSGEDVGVATTDYPLTFSPDAYETLLDDGLELRPPLQLKPGAATLRVILRDGVSGRVGTVDVPLDTAIVGIPSS